MEPEITKAEREEFRALHAKTTQGEWVTHYGERGLFSGLLWVANRGSGVIQREDLEWIARTHNALPRLLRALDAAEARIQQVHDWYADRWARLRAFLAKDSPMEKGACDIMANGHLLAGHDRKSAVVLATERAEKAEAKLVAMEAEAAALKAKLAALVKECDAVKASAVAGRRSGWVWVHVLDGFSAALAAAKEPQP